MPLFYEFFAGGGMARAGLGNEWVCTFANDFCEMKASAYAENWGLQHLTIADICKLSVSDLPGRADLAWASFPCQDLSLAGNYAGIGRHDDSEKTRSGTFWAFWQLITALQHQEREPRIIVLENVYGILTSNDGADFAAIGQSLFDAGYQFGGLLIDAVKFVPQSRPRVFIVAFRNDLELPTQLVSQEALSEWHPAAMQKAVASMPPKVRNAWVWWNLSLPKHKPKLLTELINNEDSGVRWHSHEETTRLIAMMSDRNLKKLDAMIKRPETRAVGTIYKRMRSGVQRAELRSDGVAGCLRTPAGGSSRQLVLEVNGKSVRTRLLSPREAARLMGLPESYSLPTNSNAAYRVAGDGVVVPVVRHLAASILEPILNAQESVDHMAVAAE
jgi:DNA (cytosine-5)-methyltransferase 1